MQQFILLAHNKVILLSYLITKQLPLLDVIVVRLCYPEGKRIPKGRKVRLPPG
jgi:hypothetical protein